MHPTTNTELGKLKGVIWVSRGPQHWTLLQSVSKYVHALLCCLVNGLMALDDLLIVRFINRGDCLKATVMDVTRSDKRTG